MIIIAVVASYIDIAIATGSWLHHDSSYLAIEPACIYLAT